MTIAAPTGGRIRRRLASAFVWAWGIALALVLLTAVIISGLGWELATVRTASMAPAIPEGSVAVVMPAEADALATGDVVVFDHPNRPDERVVHRIVATSRNTDGSKRFETKGDINAIADLWTLAEADITGRVRWRVPLIGRVALTLEGPSGPLVLVGAPVLIAVLLEVRDRRRRSHEPAEPGDG